MIAVTPHQAKYFAHLLECRKSGGELERLSQSLMTAQVDLQPHQIDAALFALKDPLREGVLLADEVGLGKTIEAGLVLCQLWAERKRRLLVVCPAVLRKQWAQELCEKFSLPALVADKAVLRRADATMEAFLNQQAGKAVLVVSYEFAAKHSANLRLKNWDLLVLDEAHKLRNAYKPTAKTAKKLHNAFSGSRKLLLSATPLQNSLLEFYGLSLFLDEHLFGDKKAFQRRYTGKGDTGDLRERLAPYVQRTLRQNVLEYIKYTERHTITQHFTPANDEHRLYEQISAFLQREESYALPKRQRHLTGLILRKLLASSNYAVSGTLEKIRKRLQALQSEILHNQPRVQDRLFADLLHDADEFGSDFGEEYASDDEADNETEIIDPKRLADEIALIEGFIAQSQNLSGDKKAEALLKALDTGLNKMRVTGANDKAIIFTESTRTQRYLYEFLAKHGYQGKMVLFDGSNKHPDSQAVYKSWLQHPDNAGKISGSPAVDTRTALIDYFRTSAQIMIATEAAAEGVNLQFCSLLLNYDLPWNPQRIEQRIGRCHRYGQKFDVVVINFLNARNEIDRRVLELLQEKFKLFDGVFGASDDVLGRIESGVDFEKRLAEIYDTCRTPEQIQTAFDRLQQDLEDEIAATREKAQEKLLNHFDEDVRERFKDRLHQAQDQLDKHSLLFWQLSRYALQGYAEFADKERRFHLYRAPEYGIAIGDYQLSRHNNHARLYTPQTELGQWCIGQSLNTETPLALLRFDYAAYQQENGGKISVIEQNTGKSGWLAVQKLCADTECERHESLLFSARLDGGDYLDDDFCEKLLRLPATVAYIKAQNIPTDVTQSMALRIQSEQNRLSEQTMYTLREQKVRYDRWKEDKEAELVEKLNDIKAQIRDARRACDEAINVQQMAECEEAVAKLERLYRKTTRDNLDVEEEIVAKHAELIKVMRKSIQHHFACETLFAVRWEVM